MKKKHLLVILFSFLAGALQAATVSKNDALQKAWQFLGGRQAAARGTQNQSLSLRTAYEGSAYYVFNNGENGGFVIVSADDRTPAVLGYSDRGTFDPQDVPDNMRAFLQGYADEIAHIPATATAASRSQQRAAVRSSISPLVTTEWNQRAPYNNLCPTIGGERCVTGCVATAMAQLMNYHGWPVDETKGIPGYTNGIPVAALPATKFNWTLMQNSYDAADKSDAAQEVAKLMQYCGASVQMGYGVSSSSAVTANIVTALKNYFDYDAAARYVYRTDYGYSEWVALLYNELAEGRPMVLDGQSTGGGHAFVCDGYDEDDFFHINWGWGGMSDGYFRLSNLMPPTQGTGGSSSSDGYNLELGATIGVQKNIGSVPDDHKLTVSDMLIMTDVVGGKAVTATTNSYTRNNTSTNFQVGVYSKFWNKTGSTKTFDYGWRLKKDGVSYGQKSTNPSSIDNNTAAIPGDWFSFGDGLENGTYQIVAICKLNGTEEWVECLDIENYYLEAVIDGTNMTVTAKMPAEPSLSATISDCNQLMLGVAQEVSVTMTNSGQGDFHGDIVLVFQSGNAIYQKLGGTSLDIPTGQSRTWTVSIVPTVSGTFNLIARNGTFTKGKDIASQNVTIGTPNATVNINSTYVDNSTNGTIYGNTFKVTYTATNNSPDAYKYGITAMLYKITSGNMGALDAEKTDNTVIEPGASKVYTFEFPELEYGERYFCKVYYYSINGTTRTAHQSGGGYAYTISHGFVTVDAAGNVTASAPTSSVTVPAGAVAVDLRGQSTVTSVTANSNPNTVYLLDAGAAVPTGVSGNIVKGDAAETITLTDGSDFKTPVAFTAGTVSYSRTFTQGSTGTGGWSTLILPFDVETVTVGGETIDWFHTADATNGRFWVRKFVSDGAVTVTFDYTDKIEANTPYIIAVPGDTWGEQYDLRDKTLVFSGTNKSVSSTSAVTSGNYYKMIGSTVSTAQSQVYDLNAGGSSFVLGDAQIAPFRAYFKASDIAYATTALQITSPGSGTTAVGQLPASIALPEAVYSLDGRRLTVVPAHGVYIKNGKKYVK